MSARLRGGSRIGESIDALPGGASEAAATVTNPASRAPAFAGMRFAGLRGHAFRRPSRACVSPAFAGMRFGLNVGAARGQPRAGDSSRVARYSWEKAPTSAICRLVHGATMNRMMATATVTAPRP